MVYIYYSLYIIWPFYSVSTNNGRAYAFFVKMFSLH